MRHCQYRLSIGRNGENASLRVYRMSRIGGARTRGGDLPWVRGTDSAVAMAQADICLQRAECIWVSLGSMVCPTSRYLNEGRRRSCLGARTRWCDLSSGSPKSRSKQSIRKSPAIRHTKFQSVEASMKSQALLRRGRLASFGRRSLKVGVWLKPNGIEAKRSRLRGGPCG